MSLRALNRPSPISLLISNTLPSFLLFLRHLSSHPTSLFSPFLSSLPSSLHPHPFLTPNSFRPSLLSFYSHPLLLPSSPFLFLYFRLFPPSLCFNIQAPPPSLFPFLSLFFSASLPLFFLIANIQNLESFFSRFPVYHLHHFKY